MRKIEALIFIAITIASLFYFQSRFGSITSIISGPTPVQKNPTQTNINVQPKPISPTNTIVFEELGISMEVPKEFTVTKEPVKSPDNSRVDAYNFYIQNYISGQQTKTKNFQMYGLVQYNTPATNWRELSKVKESTESYQNIKEVDYNGVIGYAMQAKGDRPRYIYMFLLTDRILTIAVSEPTEYNKSLAESILTSIKYR